MFPNEALYYYTLAPPRDGQSIGRDNISLFQRRRRRDQKVESYNVIVAQPSNLPGLREKQTMCTHVVLSNLCETTSLVVNISAYSCAESSQVRRGNGIPG
jgi:hypothetical protein